MRGSVRHDTELKIDSRYPYELPDGIFITVRGLGSTRLCADTARINLSLSVVLVLVCCLPKCGLTAVPAGWLVRRPVSDDEGLPPSVPVPGCSLPKVTPRCPGVVSEIDITVSSTSSFNISILDHLKKRKHNAFVGNTGDFDSKIGLSSLLAPSASIAQKCCHRPMAYELSDGTTSRLTPNAHVLQKCCSRSPVNIFTRMCQRGRQAVV